MSRVGRRESPRDAPRARHIQGAAGISRLGLPEVFSLCRGFVYPDFLRFFPVPPAGSPTSALAVKKRTGCVSMATISFQNQGCRPGPCPSRNSRALGRAALPHSRPHSRPWDADPGWILLGAFPELLLLLRAPFTRALCHRPFPPTCPLGVPSPPWVSH